MHPVPRCFLTLLIEGISRCEVDIRKTLMANVVLSGGHPFDHGSHGFRWQLAEEIDGDLMVMWVYHGL